MAIDTAAKRASAIFPWIPRPRSVLPAAGVDQGDRQDVAWAYRGILAGLAVPSAYEELEITSTITLELAITSTVTKELSLASTITKELAITSGIEEG